MAYYSLQEYLLTSTNVSLFYAFKFIFHVIFNVYCYACLILCLLYMFCSVYCVYCLCVNVSCITATGCQPNCS
jgi:hypothetical protein